MTTDTRIKETDVLFMILAREDELKLTDWQTNRLFPSELGGVIE